MASIWVHYSSWVTVTANMNHFISVPSSIYMVLAPPSKSITNFTPCSFPFNLIVVFCAYYHLFKVTDFVNKTTLAKRGRGFSPPNGVNRVAENDCPCSDFLSHYEPPISKLDNTLHIWIPRTSFNDLLSFYSESMYFTIYSPASSRNCFRFGILSIVL